MEGDIASFVERSREVVEDATELSARTTDLRITLPFLKALGWDVHGREVVAEHEVAVQNATGTADESEAVGDDGSEAVDDGSEVVEDGSEAVDGDESGEHDEQSQAIDEESGAVDGETVTVDYALRLDEIPVVFVVSVGYGESLSAQEGHRLETAMDAADVDWGVATDGESFVFIADGGDGPRRVQCSLPELPEREQVVGHYARPAARHRHEQRCQEERKTAAELLTDRRERLQEAVTETLVDDQLPPVVEREIETTAEAVVDGTLEALSAGRHPIEGAAAAEEFADVTGRPTPDRDASGESAGSSSPSGETSGSTAEAADRSSAEASGTTPASGEPSTDTSTVSTNGTGDDEAERAEAAVGEREATVDQQTDRPDEPDTPDGPAGREADAGAAQSGDADEGSEQEDPEDLMSRRGAASTKAGGSDESEYVVRFFSHSSSSSVGAVGHGTSAGALVQAIEYLVENHSLDGGLDLPWGPTDDRAVINHDPVHPDGTEMLDAAEISNGYHVCTTIDSEAMQEVIDELASGVNLRVMYQGDW